MNYRTDSDVRSFPHGGAPDQALRTIAMTIEGLNIGPLRRFVTGLGEGDQNANYHSSGFSGLSEIREAYTTRQ